MAANVAVARTPLVTFAQGPVTRWMAANVAVSQEPPRTSSRPLCTARLPPWNSCNLKLIFWSI